MTSLARSQLTTIALSLAVAGLGAASAAVPGAESDARLLAQQLEAVHPDLFDNLDPKRFRSTVDAIAARADELSENELVVELMRIAALPGIGDGHSGIFPADPQNRRELRFYPLRLGARLTAIAGISYAEVGRRVRPLVPRDNAMNLKGMLPHYVLTAEVLDGLGASGDTTAIALPTSGLTVRIATRYWDFSKGPGDELLAVNADRKVAVAVSDFLGGRDPVLAAALSSN